MDIHVDTGSISNTVNKNNGNPFDCVYILSKKYRNVCEIRLKNLQMPLGFYNIRAPYNTIVINGTTYTITPGNYNSTTLVNALNSAVTAGVGVFSITPISNRVQFIPASGSATITSVSTTYPTLMNILGFTSGQTGNGIVATNAYNINFDTYVYIYFVNLSTINSEAQRVAFKIPLNVGSGQIMNWVENSQDYQVLKLQSITEIFDRFIIQVYDRYGNVIDNNGIDWSFSVEIKTSA